MRPRSSPGGPQHDREAGADAGLGAQVYLGEGSVFALAEFVDPRAFVSIDVGHGVSLLARDPETLAVLAEVITRAQVVLTCRLDTSPTLDLVVERPKFAWGGRQTLRVTV